jgi:hypothetical protein
MPGYASLVPYRSGPPCGPPSRANVIPYNKYTCEKKGSGLEMGTEYDSSTATLATLKKGWVGFPSLTYSLLVKE